MSKAIYIAQLPKQEQEEIAARLKAMLIAEGLSEIEVFRAVKDAMDSRLLTLITYSMIIDSLFRMGASQHGWLFSPEPMI